MSQSTLPKATEGTVEFSVPSAGRSCQTWYKIFGDLTSGIRPLVAVHGGPGLSHDYMLPISDLTTLYSIPVIFYDQLGNGNSTHLQEKNLDESFWTEALFIAELDNLVAKLGLKEYDYLGHSWGGMLGANFAARKPEGLVKLVLSNSPSGNKPWLDAYNRYRDRLPQAKQDLLKEKEEQGLFEDPKYEEVMMEFYGRHVCTVQPWPEALQASFGWAKKDGTVSGTMLGPSEFTSKGSLENWSAVETCQDISVPTLVINGVDEGADDIAIKPFLDKIPDVKWVKFERSSHCPHFEERDKYMKVVGDWLIGK